MITSIEVIGDPIAVSAYSEEIFEEYVKNNPGVSLTKIKEELLDELP